MDPVSTHSQTDSNNPVNPSQGEQPPAPMPRREPTQRRDGVAAALDDARSVQLDDAVVAEMMGMSDSELAAAQTPTPVQSAADANAPGALVTGRIANIGSEDVLIDFGGKSLGVMSRAEFGKEEKYEVGATIEVLILEGSATSGLISVSRKKAKQAAIMRDIQPGLLVEGLITGMNKGGLDMDIEGLRGFIPASQVDLHFMKDISDLIGQRVKAEVTKFDRLDGNIVLSRRKVLMREEAEAKERAFTEMSVGQLCRGTVRSVTEYGAFVNIGGVDGLLHISDMSWGRVNKPEDVVKVGDEVEVKVIKLDPVKKKISLSLKGATANPWTHVADKYQINEKVTGRVVRLQPFGAFVELEPGVDGLLPISELSWTRRVRHPSEIVKEGDVVQVAILGVDTEKQRISLGLKQLSQDPWSVAEEKYPSGAMIKGKVVRTTEFGAFVELEEGIDGLIHISELADERVRAVTDKVKPGQDVEVRVLGVDRENQRIKLSMKTPPRMPTAEELAEFAAKRAAAAAEAKKRAEKSEKRRGGITLGWSDGLDSLDPSKFSR